MTAKTRNTTSKTHPAVAGNKTGKSRKINPKKGDGPVESIQAIISDDERMQLIAEAAYLKAETRGFITGGEQNDWLEAEKEIDAMLLAGHIAALPGDQATQA